MLREEPGIARQSMGYESEAEGATHASGEWVEMNPMQNRDKTFCTGFPDCDD